MARLSGPPASGRPPQARTGGSPGGKSPGNEREETYGPDADPGEAGRLRARPDRRGTRPLRAQGAAHRRNAPHDRGPRARRAALRRAPPAAVLRRPRGLHHRRPAGGACARGLRGGQGGAAGDRRHEPARGRAGLDPRRLRPRGPDQPRPRLRLARVVSAGDRAVLPGALILASRSPQRRAILEQLGVDFRVEAPDVEELASGEPRAVVLENARRKARAVAGDRVLAVDTAVVLDGRVFGKPGDGDEAETFLRRLSGRTHEVMSGIVVLNGRNERSDVATTRVRFRLLEQRDIDWYIATEEWRERAGGYAIQGKGAALVEEIEGDYWNVVGLPVPALLRLAPDLVGS